MDVSQPSSRHATIGRIALCSLAMGALVVTPGPAAVSFGVGFLVNTADANWNRFCGHLWRHPTIYADPIDTAMRDSIGEAFRQLEQAYRETPGVADRIAALFGRTDETKARFEIIRINLLGTLTRDNVESVLNPDSGKALGDSRAATEAVLVAAIDDFFAVPSSDQTTQKIREEIRLLLRKNLSRVVAERFAAKINDPSEVGRTLSDAVSRLLITVQIDELRRLAADFTQAQHNKARMKLVGDLVWGTGHSDVDILIGEPTRDKDREVDLSFEDQARAIFQQHKAIVIVGEGSSGKSYLAGRLLESLPDHTVVVMPLTSEAPPSLEFLRGHQTALFIDNFHETYQNLNPFAWLAALRKVSDCYVVVVSRSGRRWDEVVDKTKQSLLDRLSIHRGQSEKAVLKLEKLSGEEGLAIADRLGLEEEARRQWDGTIGSLRIDIAEHVREYQWLAEQNVGPASGTDILDAAKVLHRFRQPVYPRDLLQQIVEEVLVGGKVTNQQWQRLEKLTNESGFGSFDTAGNFRVYEVFLERSDIVSYDPADDLAKTAALILQSGNVTATFYLGVAAHLDLHDQNLAITAYEQGIALGHGGAAIQLGDLFVEQGQTYAAIDAYDQVFNMVSGNSWGSGLRAILAIDRSFQALRQGVEQGDGSAALDLGHTYADLGENAEAIVAFRRSIDLGEGRAALSLGNLHEEQGETDLAIAAYEQGIALGHGKAAFNLGLLNYQQGNVGDAVAAWMRGAELEQPDCIHVLRQLQGEHSTDAESSDDSTPAGEG